MKVSEMSEAVRLINEMDRTVEIRDCILSGNFTIFLHVAGRSTDIHVSFGLDAINLRIEQISNDMKKIGLEYDK